jgi:CheY-like chemotaxis protein
VITDINMPGLDGLALMERVHAIRPGTRVLVMTVANTPEYIIAPTAKAPSATRTRTERDWFETKRASLTSDPLG